MTSSRSRTRLAASITITALGLGGLGALTSPAQAAGISGLTAQKVATQGVGLAWNRVGDSAYRVRISTSASMSGSKTWDVTRNYHEWTRTSGSPSSTESRLTPGRTYYFQVKAVTRAASVGDRANVTGYSSPLKVTLPTSGQSELSPVDQKATAAGGTGMHLSWRSRGAGVKYMVRYTTDPSATTLDWDSATFDAAGGRVEGLTPGTRYTFRTRVLSASGTGLSDYSEPFSATTGSSSAAPALDVASYNVLKLRSTTDWKNRRSAVAATIKSARPDVIGLQEATPATWSTNKKKMYADLVDLLGSPYALVTSGAGSSGTQMAYDKSRLELVRSGSAKLAEHGSSPRYAVWARFKDRVGGKTFFVVSTHLEPGKSSTTLNNVRIRQSRQILDLVDEYSAGSPAMIVGDMNSSRSATPNNGPYRTFLGAGFVDPIDNTSATWTTGADTTAEHVVAAEYNTANALERTARVNKLPRGTHIDYVFTEQGIRVGSWKQFVNVDTKGKFIGTIPSDHNLIQASVHLP